MSIKYIWQRKDRSEFAQEVYQDYLDSDNYDYAKIARLIRIEWYILQNRVKETTGLEICNYSYDMYVQSGDIRRPERLCKFNYITDNIKISMGDTPFWNDGINYRFKNPDHYKTYISLVVRCQNIITVNEVEVLFAILELVAAYHAKMYNI